MVFDLLSSAALRGKDFEALKIYTRELTAAYKAVVDERDEVTSRLTRKQKALEDAEQTIADLEAALEASDRKPGPGSSADPDQGQGIEELKKLESANRSLRDDLDAATRRAKAAEHIIDQSIRTVSDLRELFGRGRKILDSFSVIVGKDTPGSVAEQDLQFDARSSSTSPFDFPLIQDRRNELSLDAENNTEEASRRQPVSFESGTPRPRRASPSNLTPRTATATLGPQSGPLSDLLIEEGKLQVHLPGEQPTSKQPTSSVPPTDKPRGPPATISDLRIMEEKVRNRGPEEQVQSAPDGTMPFQPKAWGPGNPILFMTPEEEEGEREWQAKYVERPSIADPESLASSDVPKKPASSQNKESLPVITDQGQIKLFSAAVTAPRPSPLQPKPEYWKPSNLNEYTRGGPNPFLGRPLPGGLSSRLSERVEIKAPVDAATNKRKAPGRFTPTPPPDVGRKKGKSGQYAGERDDLA
ncbi:MAG: hypothetical protein L6R40_003584 [Gallowayella cf. fulva]|nr:MAG: hypothetical protein L6R40_003584 [Xanthomendoza cf. fulva]